MGHIVFSVWLVSSKRIHYTSASETMHVFCLSLSLYSPLRPRSTRAAPSPWQRGGRHAYRRRLRRALTRKHPTIAENDRSERANCTFQMFTAE